jgi:hypothetical protein
MNTYPKKTMMSLMVLGGFALFSVIFFREQILKTIFGMAYDVALRPSERTFCLNTEDDYRCITDRAIQEKDASICYYLDVGNSDRCVDDAIIGAKNVAVCNKIKNQESKKYCFDQYK